MGIYTYEKKELLELFFRYKEEIKLRFSMKNVLFDNENMFLDNIMETYKAEKNNITINILLDKTSRTCSTQDIGKVLSLQDKDLTFAINKTYKEFKPNTFKEVEKFSELVCYKYYYYQFLNNMTTIIKYILCSEIINYICNITTTTIAVYKDISTMELFDKYLDDEVLPKYQNGKPKPLLEIKNIEIGKLYENCLNV